MYIEDKESAENEPATIAHSSLSEMGGDGALVSARSVATQDNACHGASAAGVQRQLVTGGRNFIDFGTVHIRERRAKTITIVNQGKFPLEFQWDLPRASRHVTLSPLSGSVPRGGSVTCELSFYCKKEAVVEHMMAMCSFVGASKSKRFTLDIGGQGKKPRLDFSFSKYNFGPRFVASDSAGGILRCCSPVTKILTIVNREEEQNVAVDVRHDDRSHLMVGKDGRMGNTVLAAGESMEVPIVFRPNDVRKFRDTIHFEINGLYTVPVALHGEGTPLRVELLDPSMASVDFGALRPGQSIVRTIVLVNRSRRAVECSLNVNGAGGRDSGRHTMALFMKALHILPERSTKFVLAPKEEFECELCFSPNTQMSAFTQDVMLKCVGMNKPLLSVSGMCLGVGLALHSERLVFGHVVENCSLTKKLMVSNVGDVGCRFDFQEIGSDAYTITPSQGFLAAHGVTNLEVTFRPTEQGANYNFEDILCLVDGKKASGMSISLTGTCVAQAEEDATELQFTTRVRRSQVQEVTITNPTSSRWELKPRLENPFWHGDSRIVVPAEGSVQYTLTYRPLTMTNAALSELGVGGEEREEVKDAKAAPPKGKDKGKSKKGSQADSAADFDLPAGLFSDGKPPQLPDKHVGSLFMPLPNGTALSYRLVGTALAPAAEDKLEVDVLSKKQCTQLLPLRNWLDQYQRFKVLVETTATSAIKSEGKEAAKSKSKGKSTAGAAVEEESSRSSTSLVRLTSADTIDIPAMQKRAFKLSYLAYQLGTTKATVTFLNEKTGEFMFYNITFTAEKTSAQSPISLKAAIRQKVASKVTVVNPFDVVGNLTGFRCEDPAVHVNLPVKVYPNSHEVVEVSYRPLVEGQHTELPLYLECDELGEFMYTLQLDPPAAPAERALRFNTALGSECTQVFKFRSFSSEPVEFEASLAGSGEFSVEQKVQAPAAPAGGEGVEVAVEVVFEPSGLGSVRDELTILGKGNGGKYTCSLIGIAEAPRPRGPVSIAPGGSGQIKFKNVLADAETFDFVCDNPAFQVSKRTEKIARKAVAQINVSYKPMGKEVVGPNGSVNAKLIATCPSLTHAWVYYLEGLPASS